MYDPYSFSYIPDGYQNPYMMRNSMQMPQQPAVQTAQAAPAAPQQNGPNWIMAPTVQAVEQVSVAPGGKSWIMVQNAPVFALRTADQMGLITTEYYRFEKIDPASLTAPATPSQEYVTREEFQRFVDSLAAKQPTKRGKEMPEA